MAGVFECTCGWKSDHAGRAKGHPLWWARKGDTSHTISYVDEEGEVYSWEEAEERNLGRKGKMIDGKYVRFKPERKPPTNETRGRPPGRKMIPTDNPAMAALIQMVSQTITIPNVPGILVPYLAAKASGFRGELADWLCIIGADFWEAREVNPYEAVGMGYMVLASERKEEENASTYKP